MKDNGMMLSLLLRTGYTRIEAMKEISRLDNKQNAEDFEQPKRQSQIAKFNAKYNS